MGDDSLIGSIIFLGLIFFGFVLVVSVISALIWRATGDAILGLLVGFLLIVMAPFIIKFLEWYEERPRLKKEDVVEIVKKWAEENGVEVKSIEMHGLGTLWTVFMVDALGRIYSLDIDDKTKNIIEDVWKSRLTVPEVVKYGLKWLVEHGIDLDTWNGKVEVKFELSSGKWKIETDNDYYVVIADTDNEVIDSSKYGHDEFSHAEAKTEDEFYRLIQTYKGAIAIPKKHFRRKDRRLDDYL